MSQPGYNIPKDSPTAFSLAVANGTIPQWSSEGQSGKTFNQPTSDFTTIWDGNPTIGNYIPPTTDRIHDISSSAAADGVAGTGVQEIFIQGVNTLSDNITSELLTMNGTTPVSTVNQYTHIHRMTATAWGSGLQAAGNISAVAQVDATTTALLIAGRNNTLTGVFQIPRNNNQLITNVTFSISRSGGATAGAEFRFIIFKQGEGFVESIDIGLDDSSPVHTIPIDPPSAIGPLSYVAPQGLPDATNVTLDVIYRFYLAPVSG